MIVITPRQFSGSSIKMSCTPTPKLSSIFANFSIGFTMTSWKFSLLVALLILTEFIPSNQALEINPMILKQVKKLRLRCVNQTGVSVEIMEKSVRDQMFPYNEKLNCFLHCMFDMFGLIDTQNVMHLESLKEVLPEEIHDTINGLVSSCGTKKGKDGCETAYETVKCYIDVNSRFIWREVIVLLG
ncbi:general odorant-binding protein 69a [Drosophila kikkawai]|uniref:General odorant-binding protein 69a n=1 Tax=Drosophila kikkawai TaxID=30033 RepID=A0A6P4JHK1_DROKI|nr:general odorant-binding protein 69a [Drosophila kikkawai]